VIVLEDLVVMSAWRSVSTKATRPGVATPPRIAMGAEA
jgi:hypothetical protein